MLGSMELQVCGNQNAIWHALQHVHIAFLTEAHHTHVPENPEWRTIGTERHSQAKAGGVLVQYLSATLALCRKFVQLQILMGFFGWNSMAYVGVRT